MLERISSMKMLENKLYVTLNKGISTEQYIKIRAFISRKLRNKFGHVAVSCKFYNNDKQYMVFKFTKKVLIK